MFDLNALIRDNVKNLKPYQSARLEFSGAAELFLDANENSFGSVVDGGFNRYPDPLQHELKQQIAAQKGVSSEQIFIGNGSDEAIDLLFRAFCRPGLDQVVTMPPTYGMYDVSAAVNDVAVVPISLTPEFAIDLPRVKAALQPPVKMLFICSPNNPTGNCFDAAVIVDILNHFNGIVILDEAYIDFAPNKSLLPRLAEFPNLVILQTFSKAWGMAGLRVGMAFANPVLIEVLNKIKPPYNVNSLTQQLVLKALEQVEAKNEMVRQILTQREWLTDALQTLNFVLKIYPTDANFILIKTTHPGEIYHHLTEHGIIVRDRSRVPLCEGCLRITVGTPEQNQRLIDSCHQLDQNL